MKDVFVTVTTVHLSIEFYKTFPCKIYPLKPHVYIEITGVCRDTPIFLIFHLKQNIVGTR